jgi:hypothetical protein
MGHVARKLSSVESEQEWPSKGTMQEHGVILRINGRSIIVRSPSGEVEAKRAHSCLVEPLVGDYVLVSCSSRKDAYVLAVLEREVGVATTLEVEGDLRIAPVGRVTIASPLGIDLESTQEVRVTSNHLEVDAQRGSFVINQLSLLSGKVEAQMARARVIGEALDSVFQRVSQTVKRSFRVVEETDHLEARDVQWSSTETMSIHSKNTLLTSDELVKLDGTQIHLG